MQSKPYGASSVLARPTIEPVANRVWVVRGGLDYATIPLQAARGNLPRRTMNVYLIKEHDGVTMFDAGIHDDGRAAARARRADGRAQADRARTRARRPPRRRARLGVPVYCHADAKAEAEDAEPSRPYHDYSRYRRSALPRAAYPR